MAAPTSREQQGAYGAFIQQLTDLPSVPIVVQKLHTMISDRNVGSNAVARVVETDAALVARLVKLVNSPFYGFPRRITSVEEAIAILGFNVLHQLVLTTAVADAFAGLDRSFDMNGFWLHSFGVGVMAKNLLPAARRDEQNEALMCGILHDLGRLVYLRADARRFAAFYRNRNALISIADEETHLGQNHQQVGELLARKWNFPEAIAVVIANHHTPTNAPLESRTLVSAVHVADVICHAMHIGHSVTAYVAHFEPQAWAHLSLTSAALEQVLLRSLTEIEKAGSLIRDL